MIDYLIVIPVYKVHERTIKCLNSIKDYEHVLLVDNTGVKDCEQLINHYPGIRVSFQDENIGVPRAWNIGIDEGHDWTFLVSSSMVFKTGFKPIAKMLENYNDPVFRTNHAWHCIGISKKAIEIVGRFDENFYPGYLEDCDWDFRYSLARLQENGNFPIHAVCQVDGGATRDGAYVMIAPLRKYFVEKWGGPELAENEGEPWFGVPTIWTKADNIYSKPFNNENNDIGYWEQRSIEELREKYGFNDL
jgi:Ni,Fe-hydrogenase maturation factor